MRLRLLLMMTRCVSVTQLNSASLCKNGRMDQNDVRGKHSWGHCVISRVDSCKSLGIIIDRNLSWKEYMDYVYKKVIKFTSIFYKIRTKLMKF